jgi:hypothetical protein
MYGSYEKSESRAWVVTTKVEVRLLKMIKAFKASIGEVQGCDARGRGCTGRAVGSIVPAPSASSGQAIRKRREGTGAPTLSLRPLLRPGHPSCQVPLPLEVRSSLLERTHFR